MVKPNDAIALILTLLLLLFIAVAFVLYRYLRPALGYGSDTYGSSGNSLKEEPVSFQYYFDQKVSEVKKKGRLSDCVPVMPIYTCDDEVPPGYPGRKCKKSVELRTDLNEIPREAWQRRSGPANESYYKIPFQVEMICHSAHITWTLVHETVQDGQVTRTKYSSVTAEYI
ncbi:hypothetical protein F4780DRAFT_781161 [Xylariomycetidae sp. FL0641]|nr:hypothetical protein F4780DRAFT_781161 [Xylariomycetidae sp. FL0641]